MDKENLFQFLSKQDKTYLLNLLGCAYDTLKTNELHEVFGAAAQKAPSPKVDGASLLKEVNQFKKESIAGKYYAPFDINSKNYMNIPEETEEWFEKLSDLLKASCKLTEQDDNDHAVQCFDLLYELIDIMESGDEIVFADELGSWMIPGNEKEYVAAYVQSLSATLDADIFAKRCIPLLERDRQQSFTLQVFKSAMDVATPEQVAALKETVSHLKIPTVSKSR